jgi:predicted AlkP superfamily pyrophosphatase or phosphodiesterase
MRVARFLAVLICGLQVLAHSTAAQRTTPATPNKQLLVVVDGLRPDYVRLDIMPNLYALGRRGVIFNNHHAVFPTVTRVNASSMVTGTYPERHGVLGNAVFFPQVNPREFFDTGDRQNLLKINDSLQGKLLAVPSLGEILEANGRKLLVVGAGTTGVAYLLNHKISGGAVLHTEFSLPDSLSKEVASLLGPPPPAAYPNDARNRRAVETFLKIGIKAVDPSVTIIWLSDPDTTAHRFGVGHPTTVEALKRVDQEIKRLEDGLAALGLLDSYNIWVTSDHGFATHTGAVDIDALLKPFAGTLPDGSPRIVADAGAIYVRDHDKQTITQIVSLLQKTEGIGAIFTAPEKSGAYTGWAEGTLSFDTARWGHERSADILYSPDWSDIRNPYGFEGTSASNGTAGHGSTSPFEIHNTLMAAGPDVRQKIVIPTPSGNVDFAPTFLRLLNIQVPASMQGRILQEALRNGANFANRLLVQTVQVTAKTADDSYSQIAFLSFLRGGRGVPTYRYLDHTQVTRSR